MSRQDNGWDISARTPGQECLFCSVSRGVILHVSDPTVISQVSVFTTLLFPGTLKNNGEPNSEPIQVVCND